MSVESGIKELRAHFIRETTVGVTPANPDWLRFGDTLRQISEAPNANVYMQMGAGVFDLTGFLVGPEDHTMGIEYELQNWLTAGNDAAADGLLRAADGGLLNTHSFQSRQELAAGGVLASGSRIYTIAKGGHVGRVTLSGEPNSGEPLKTRLDYVFEKIRSYVIDQPAATGVCTIRSTNAGDTTQSLTIENEGAGTSETIALNGTTPVAGITSFADIDAAELDAETIGDVIIEHSGQDVMTILGQTSNGGFEGDLGIPLLGTGSFEAALASAYEIIVGSTILRGGAVLEEDATISSFEIQIENNLDVHPRIDSRRRRIIEGKRDISANVTIFSRRGSHDSLVANLTADEQDIVWTLTGGTITLSDTALTSVGGRSYEAGKAVMTRNNVFTGRGLVIA